jgi:PDZ-binding kinase
MLYERSPRNDVVRSPWAIKKLQKKISIKSEYAKRLEEEADVLKKLQHPNIIGYRGKPKNNSSYIITFCNG